MKVMTILGTRPEIIRLSRIVPQLDRLAEHLFVHTGQNYEESLSGSFLGELGLRAPDVNLGVRAESFGEQVAQVLERVDRLLGEKGPDRIVILGDTNSALSAIVAARRGIPVFHLEAGNRCYDDRVPEEVNRRLIDHASTVLLPYTERGKENLVREGIERDRIFVVGNPIFEVLEAFAPAIASSGALGRMGVSRQGYFLATFHRAENVDDPERLAALLDSLGAVTEKWSLPLLASVHPRTADKIARFSLGAPNALVRLLPPLGFSDFIRLERDARCVLTDSGTVQEECAIFRVPNATVRDVTERPETIECGSNILCGVRRGSVVAAMDAALSLPAGWNAPAGYEAPDVSRAVVKIVLGFLSLRRHRGEPGA